MTTIEELPPTFTTATARSEDISPIIRDQADVRPPTTLAASGTYSHVQSLTWSPTPPGAGSR
jgi:hypothetical protein